MKMIIIIYYLITVLHNNIIIILPSTYLHEGAYGVKHEQLWGKQTKQKNLAFTTHMNCLKLPKQVIK